MEIITGLNPQKPYALDLPKKEDICIIMSIPTCNYCITDKKTVYSSKQKHPLKIKYSPAQKRIKTYFSNVIIRKILMTEEYLELKRRDAATRIINEPAAAVGLKK